jgi:uncharacterized protein YnzC (UPF0291/DUF896 family)
MEQAKIDRINALAKKQKAEGLTEEEKKEQGILREEYLSLIRKNFRNTIETVSIKEPDGSIRSLRRH